MIDLATVIKTIIDPGLAQLPMAMDSPKARVMLLTIGQQESKFNYRYQVLAGGGKGPARGWPQFEKGGGVRGVMNHPATSGHAHRLCLARNVAWDAGLIWSQLEYDDLLACGFARLLLYSDPKPLPELDDVEGAWKLYAERTWRPGKPHRETWDAYHLSARKALALP